jgi:hypothetical protein
MKRIEVMRSSTQRRLIQPIGFFELALLMKGNRALERCGGFGRTLSTRRLTHHITRNVPRRMVAPSGFACRHDNIARRIIPFIRGPHLQIRRFDIAAITVGIEERRSQSIACELQFQLLQ